MGLSSKLRTKGPTNIDTSDDVDEGPNFWDCLAECFHKHIGLLVGI
jgi:hypothetical protein